MRVASPGEVIKYLNKGLKLCFAHYSKALAGWEEVPLIFQHKLHATASYMNRYLQLPLESDH